VGIGPEGSLYLPTGLLLFEMFTWIAVRISAGISKVN
jgi:hypothetical protein